MNDRLFIVSLQMENSYFKAIVLMVLSSLFFALMSLMVSLAGDLPLFEKIFFRNLISLFVAIVIIKREKGTFFGSPGNRGLLLLRSFSGFMGIMLYFYAISYMNLADSAMLNKLSPFFVILSAAIFLKEKLKIYHIIAIVIAFLASLLIIKPHFDMEIIPALAGFSSAVFAGIAYSVIRALKIRGESSGTIVFYFSLVSFLISLIPAAINFVLPVGTQWIYLIGIGIFAAGGQITMTQSYQYAKASDIAPFKYLHVLFAGLMGFIFLGEHIDFYSLAGYVIIFAVYLYMFAMKRRDQ